MANYDQQEDDERDYELRFHFIRYLEHEAEKGTNDYFLKLGHAFNLKDPQAIEQVRPNLEKLLKEGPLPPIWRGEFKDMYVAPKAYIPPTPVKEDSDPDLEDESDADDEASIERSISPSSFYSAESAVFERSLEDPRSPVLTPDAQVGAIKTLRKFRKTKEGEYVEVMNPATTEQLLEDAVWWGADGMRNRAEVPSFNDYGDDEELADDEYSDSEIVYGESYQEFSDSEIEQDYPHSPGPQLAPATEEYVADEEKRDKGRFLWAKSGPKPSLSCPTRRLRASCTSHPRGSI
jgi:hypothetical protein